MILSENKEILGIKPNNVKSSFLDKFQEYEPLYTCSPKNSFYLNSLNSSNQPSNKNELRNPVLFTETNNYNSQNNSKLGFSFDKFTSDFAKGTNPISSSKSKYIRNRDGVNAYFGNGFNSQNTNPNTNGYSSGNSQIAYKNLLMQQQENRFARMKKEKILSLLDERPAAYVTLHNNNNNSNKLSHRNSSERTLGKNYFSSSFYAFQGKSPKNNIESSQCYNSILHENPEIKKRIDIVNGNSNNKNGYTNITSGYNIDNFGLVPTSNNSSFNVLNNNNYNKSNAGKEFAQFLHESKHKQNKDFHHKFINSPLKIYAAANRNSLKNLNAVKSHLENLFEKNDKKDKGSNNNAMDNLCAFLNQKNKKANGANIQQTDKSVKLMEQIKDIR